MRAAIAFLAAGLTALAAAPEARAAQPEGLSAPCSDDRGVDRCDPAEHRRMLDLFGLLPVEDHVEAGSQLRRVMYVDGYGRNVVAIVFIRPRAAEPVVRIHFPRRADGSRIDPIEAPVPPQVWNDVLSGSDRFHRELPPEARGRAQAGEPFICIHPWVYVVETVEPERSGAAARVRGGISDACSGGAAVRFGREVQAAAIGLLPHCDLLDPDLHRTDAARLAACAMLTGDRRTAAMVHNAGLRLAFGETEEEVAHLFGPDATLERNGETVSGRAAAEGWGALLTGPEASFLFLTGVHGESPGRARLDGFLLRYGDEEEDQPSAPSSAEVTMTWRDGGRGDFRIESVRVGAFVPVPPRAAIAD